MEKKESKVEEKTVAAKEEAMNGPSLTDKMRENPWVVATFVLGIVTLILLISNFSGGLNGGAGVAPQSDVQAKVLQFVKSQVTDPVSVVNTSFKDGFYQVLVLYQGKDIPVYVSADGKNLVQGIMPLDQLIQTSQNTTPAQTQPTTVTKSDKPVVEAFVFAYCPYGLQFEKALFPVYDLLKAKADINIVYIGAMHGEFEHVESLRQIAILKLYGNDKLFAYLKEFDVNTNIGSCNGDATCLDKYLPAIYTKLGMNKANIESYMNTNSEAIYQADEARASSLGISGSPTFVINGAQAQVSRTPDSIGKAVCNAFNTTPTECSTALSTAATSAGFGASTGSVATTGTQCATA
jgi:hypothetical protein